MRRGLIIIALGLVSCSSSVTTKPSRKVPVKEPLRADGVVCASPSQCESGGCSGDMMVGSCGVCLPAKSLGESCGGPQTGCGQQAVCDSGICETTEVPLGERCELGPLQEDAGRCTDEGYCLRDETVLAGGVGTCLPRAQIGEACKVSGGPTCLKGAVCEKGQCVPDLPRGVGESCEQASCSENLYCDPSFVCRVPTLGEDDACELDYLGCVPGLVCGNLDFPDGGGAGAPKTCLPLPGDGEPCIHDQCASDLVCERALLPNGAHAKAICARPHAEGEACGDNFYGEHVCQDTLECRAHVCRQACR